MGTYQNTDYVAITHCPPLLVYARGAPEGRNTPENPAKRMVVGANCEMVFVIVVLPVIRRRRNLTRKIKYVNLAPHRLDDVVIRFIN